MRRSLLFLFSLAAASLAHGAILPDTIGHWQHGDPGPAPVPDAAVWQEYGLQESETMPYSDGARKFTVAAYRFSDATGAMAAFDQVRPQDAKTVQIMGMSAQTDTKQIVSGGNFLFVTDGYHLLPEELSHLFATVPRYSRSPLPTLPKYLPAGAAPNSERYITGPVSLAKFAPMIPPSTAAFRFSAEGVMAKYGPSEKETTLVIFSYPTMEMARERNAPFSQIPGVVVKRTGPLLAVVLGSPSPDDAEKLLAQVKYQADVTVPHREPGLKDNPANLLWNIAILCGVLIALCLTSGLAFGGMRILFRRAGPDGDENQMISLHLSGKP
ncbi:MAG TPA: DUF6599 family protein [Bryobacteraceae bacterium]|nr:DUF6599 family protein [Bryobacteraceae bacterium]